MLRDTPDTTDTGQPITQDSSGLYTVTVQASTGSNWGSVLVLALVAGALYWFSNRNERAKR